MTTVLNETTASDKVSRYMYIFITTDVLIFKYIIYDDMGHESTTPGEN